MDAESKAAVFLRRLLSFFGFSLLAATMAPAAEPPAPTPAAELSVPDAIVLGVIEGVTEYLPISSTGHLIIAGDLIGFHTGPSADTFYIAIQAGAIVAVCWHYRERIFAILRNLFVPGKEQRLAVNTVIAFIPAAFLGVLLSSTIKAYLFNPAAVAAAANGLKKSLRN